MSEQSIVVLGLHHGARHVQGFLAAGAKRVYAVDINQAAYTDIPHDERITFSQDYRLVLPAAKMIVISLPPALHKEALLAAMETHASRVWIEEPLLNIGEGTSGLTESDKRVEVIHELRRCQTVRDWIAGGNDFSEAWFTWCRPVPPAHNPKHGPIGVVRDLGSHLVDLAFALTRQDKPPTIDITDFAHSPNDGVQDVQFTLHFGEKRIHVRAAWIDPTEWPEREITVKLRTSSGEVSWASKKSTHRHLTASGAPTTEQMAEEKDWYKAAVQGDDTYFTPLKTAILTQNACNDIVKALKGENV